MKVKNIFIILSFLFISKVFSQEIEILSLDVIPYSDFIQGNDSSLLVLESALHEKGIVGIKGVPGYKEKVLHFIEAARKFSLLPEAVKELYAPNRLLGEFLGYEIAKEKFKRPDGQWVVDDLKASFYGFVPDHPMNKWPPEVDLKESFLEIGTLMSEIGAAVMEKIQLIGGKTGIDITGIPRVGRMLHYRKSVEGVAENPYWCGAHYDHGLFTVLLPAFYFENGEILAEPTEAGLFVRPTSDGVFKKVIANDPDIMLFQVGEFGQLATDDAFRATEHRVHKALGCVERYTMALFFNAPQKTVIHSYSELTKDSRYGGILGDPCSYQHWSEESLKRYLVNEEEEED